MKLITLLAACTLLIGGCTSTSSYHYQSEQNPQQWQGKNIAAVEKQWGSANDVLHTASGTSYYLYTTTSGRNFFSATSTNFSLAESSADFPLRGQAGLKCSAVFKTNSSGTIISTSHAGNNCGGEWAPN